MATLDIFRQDAFSMISMTEAVEKAPYKPGFLGSIPDLIVPKPVRTESVAIEEREGVLSVIQTSERGAPLAQRGTERRKVRDFRTVRIAKGDRLTASELQNIRAFGSESEFMQVQDEVMRRLGGPTGLRAEVELTHEHMRLGMVQGKMLDADGSVIYDWFQEFGIPEPAEIDFDLDNASPEPGVVRKKCTQVVRAVMRGLGGVVAPGFQIIALCGDAFWDDLTAHSEVRETYLNQQEAADLRQGNAFGVLNYGGITFINYRGTDDNSKVAVGADKCRFFPSVPGVFEMAMAPAETFDFVNTPGQSVYSMIVWDKDRNAWVDIEVYSYPLFICKRPAALQRAKRT
ncbi:major capsid protein [Telmatospirillum sp. J64-1]|uniref:major capsid protein n=1 Tax=Telmatospirillum sp. J64-1 TaxID=2502183 RepID=UPI00115F0F51|nr:major capsid protein [Telmatospirillum sp. J64-1]